MNWPVFLALVGFGALAEYIGYRRGQRETHERVGLLLATLHNVAAAGAREWEDRPHGKDFAQGMYGAITHVVEMMADRLQVDLASAREQVAEAKRRLGKDGST